VDATLGQQRSGDAGHLVGERYGDDLERAPRLHPVNSFRSFRAELHEVWKFNRAYHFLDLLPKQAIALFCRQI
jgi:hypothetical protein